jgi:hypothetical protein
MHDLGDAMTTLEIERLRDLRATTMLRLAANRIHQNYAAGTLDPATRQDVETALTELKRLGGEIAHDRSARVVSAGIGRLADAFDSDDHVAGQAEIASAAPTMVAMAVLSEWEVGSLNPF